MDNSLFLPITILILIVVLFIMVGINKRKVNVVKRKKLIEAVFALKGDTVSEETSKRRDSIIKLDNLLSKSLQVYFNNNALCGDNLKNAKKIFRKKEYESLWQVHKLRNKIVHDDYVVNEQEAKDAFEIYKISIIKILQ
jgi:hypothetical protein